MITYKFKCTDCGEVKSIDFDSIEEYEAYNNYDIYPVHDTRICGGRLERYDNEKDDVMKYRVIKNTDKNDGSYNTEKFNMLTGIWEQYDGKFENGEDKDAIKFCESDGGHSATWDLHGSNKEE